MHQDQQDKRRNNLEKKIIELENRKAEMEENACYILADILAGQIETLKNEVYNC